MSAPFDVAELNATIGDDAETLGLLLGMFVESTEESLDLLKKELKADQDAAYDQLWKSHMHQIKGASLNLGARHLAELAKDGQDQFEAEPDLKRKLLADVIISFAEVKNYIGQLGYGQAA